MNAIDSALGAEWAAKKRRHDILQTDAERVYYGNWRISYDRNPPLPCGAWVWWHVKHSHLTGRQHSLRDALNQCDHAEDTRHTEDTKPCPSCGRLPGYPCYEQCPDYIEPVGEVHGQEAVSPIVSAAEGYRNAFYEIAKMLNMPAMPMSPQRAWETEMRPRLEALIAKQGAA